MNINKSRAIVSFIIIITILSTACGTTSSTAFNKDANRMSDEELKKVFDKYSPLLDGAYADD